MSTKVRKKVGKLAGTPGMAVTPAGKEVKAPVAATPVAAQGPQEATVAPKGDAAAAAQAFLTAFGLLRDALAPYLRVAAPGAKPGGHGVSSKRVAVIPSLANLLSAHPELAVTVQPDAMIAGLSTAATMRQIALNVHELHTQLLETARLETADSWRGASAVYVAANHQARTDKAMENSVAPIRSALALGKRQTTQASTASAASHKATAAQTRATRAQHGAQVASAAQSLGSQAHALRHPTPASPLTPAVNQGPAASVAAPNQGPSASAEANAQGPAVNPQGPAPGR